jgi:hypothetical protein
LSATGALPVIGATYIDHRKTMARMPRDRFDDIPADLARVGAHRAPLRRGRGWITFAWALLATGVLVAAGVFALTSIESRVANTGPSTTIGSAPKPTIDPKMDVVLLNATSTNGLAASASSALKKQGWSIGSTANASSTAVKTTTVYYTKAGQAGAAAGLAKSLGIARTTLSAQFSVPGQDRLTVVLGEDYAAKH